MDFGFQHYSIRRAVFSTVKFPVVENSALHLVLAET